MASLPAAASIVSAKLDALIADVRARDPQVSRISAAAALRFAKDDETREKLLSILRRSAGAGVKRRPKFNLISPERKDILIVQRSKPGETHKTIAGELNFLGLPDEAAPEYEAALIEAAPRFPVDAAYTLSTMYAKGDRGDRAARFAQTLSDVEGSAQIFDPAIARLFYPAPFRNGLRSCAAANGVDPRLLLSITRQESGFRPYARSNSAARGILQFISTTADDTARSLGLPDFRSDDLYDPETSILFGCRHVRDLFTVFPELPDAVAGAYNAGDDNMKRWLGRSKSRMPEHYVPEIAFAQTKDYVYRVMSNYRMYRLLYDEDLNIKNESVQK
jgi:soluble lytic murein transglycosylase